MQFGPEGPLIMILFPNQIATGESARHPQQRSGASHGPPAPSGPGRHQHGDHGCGQRPAADHRGQLTQTMISTAVQPTQTSCVSCIP